MTDPGAPGTPDPGASPWPPSATPPSPQPGGWYQASDGLWYPTHGAAPSGYDTPQSSYGAPYGGYPYGGGYPYAAPVTNGLAIASLICSCGGIFLLGIPGVLGIIFGFVARKQIAQSNGAQSGAGMALAGILVGFGVIALYLLVLLIIVATAKTVTPNCC
jgi:hypothetical protein